MATINTSIGKVTYTDTVGQADRPVTATLWEKNGNVRVYFKVRHERGVEDCGYYDVKNKIAYTKSSPAAWGHEIKASIVFTPTADSKPETFNTGFGYYGTANDAARGFDGIE